MDSNEDLIHWKTKSSKIPSSRIYTHYSMTLCLLENLSKCLLQIAETRMKVTSLLKVLREKLSSSKAGSFLQKDTVDVLSLKSF